MSDNLYSLFRRLTPAAPLQAGVVVAVNGDWATIDLPGNGRLQVRGSAPLGQQVFVRDGRLESEAPNLPVDLIDL